MGDTMINMIRVESMTRAIAAAALVITGGHQTMARGIRAPRRIIAVTAAMADGRRIITMGAVGITITATRRIRIMGATNPSRTQSRSRIRRTTALAITDGHRTMARGLRALQRIRKIRITDATTRRTRRAIAATRKRARRTRSRIRSRTRNRNRATMSDRADGAPTTAAKWTRATTAKRRTADGRRDGAVERRGAMAITAITTPTRTRAATAVRAAAAVRAPGPVRALDRAQTRAVVIMTTTKAAKIIRTPTKREMIRAERRRTIRTESRRICGPLLNENLYCPSDSV